MGDPSCARLGKEIIARFNQLSAVSRERPLPGFKWDKFEYEAERFRTWASSLDLFGREEISLDYRLRDCEMLKQYVGSLLQDLEHAVELMHLCCVQTQPLSEKEVENDPDLSDQSEDEIEASTILSELNDINDRLYRFSAQVQDPKLLFYSTIPSISVATNASTEMARIDLLRKVDEVKIREMFRCYRSRPRDEPGEITRTDETLISRLVNGNVYRRQQLSNWERNRAVGHLPIVKDDDASTQGSGLTSHHAFDPPQILEGAAHLVCPYCYFVFAGPQLERSEWREHLVQDLRPFVCTYSDCKEGDQLYERLEDWASHERWAHNRIWCCHYHPQNIFFSRPSFEQHWHSQHQDRKISLEDAAEANASVLSVPGRSCPICFHNTGNLDLFQQHIAEHLIEVAVLALPGHSDQLLAKGERAIDKLSAPVPRNSTAHLSGQGWFGGSWNKATREREVRKVDNFGFNKGNDFSFDRELNKRVNLSGQKWFEDSWNKATREREVDKIDNFGFNEGSDFRFDRELGKWVNKRVHGGLKNLGQQPDEDIDSEIADAGLSSQARKRSEDANVTDSLDDLIGPPQIRKGVRKKGKGNRRYPDI